MEEDCVKIVLDNYQNETYYPGQTIVGKVDCSFRSKATIKAIRIIFKGRAKTRWSSGGSKLKTMYLGEEIYFDQEYNLFGGEAEIEIPAGKHTYPFSYILPQTLPTVFIGVNGNIKYKIKTIVDRPCKFDYEDTFLFFVTSPLDLNQLPGLKNPFAQSIEETISSCCADAGSIAFTVVLPFTGYAIGQRIDVGTYVENMSRLTIKKIEYNITRRDEFIAIKPSKKHKFEDHTVAEVTSGPLRAYSEKSWATSLDVSPVEIGNLQSCSIINCYYNLHVKLILPCCYKNLTVSCPLTFGTVPLSGVDNTMLSSTAQLQFFTKVPAYESSPFLQNISSNSGEPHVQCTASPSERLAVSTVSENNTTKVSSDI